MTGSILIDGHSQTFPAFSRLCGYCEQQDNHVGTQTVREALEFSARLRLSSALYATELARFVEQILSELELSAIADRLIGDATVEGLSPGELKRVTIGVELAANPTFLFLDEVRTHAAHMQHVSRAISLFAHVIVFAACPSLLLAANQRPRLASCAHRATSHPQHRTPWPRRCVHKSEDQLQASSG